MPSIEDIIGNIFKSILESPEVLIQIGVLSIIFIISYMIVYFGLFKKRISFSSFEKEDIIKVVIGFCIIISILFNLYFIDFTTDDAFISFRYSKNLVNGSGIVFNPNTENPVEGYSNFLWLIINAFPIFLNLDIVIWFKLFSIVLNIISIIYLYKLATCFYSDKIALGAPVIYVIYYPIQLWTIGGLEVPLILCSIILSLYFMINELERNMKFPRFSIIFFTINILTRIDGIIFYIGIEGITILYYLYKKKNPLVLQRIFAMIIIGGIFCIYFLWRYMYYGYFFPNPYYAKADSTNLITQQGVNYISYFIVFTIPIMVLFIFSIINILIKKNQNLLKITLISLIPILINFLIVLHLEKHYAGQGFRFLLPSMPFIILISLYSFEILKENREAKFKLEWNAILNYFNKIIPVLFCFLFIIYPLTAPLIRVNTTNTDVNTKYHKLALWLKSNVNSNTTIAFTDMGIVPYYSELNFIDLWGLNDEILARDRANYDYILDQSPEFIFIKANNLLEIKNITLQPDFQNNYTVFYVLELFEINQYLFQSRYNLTIYKHNNFIKSNSSLISLFS